MNDQLQSENRTALAGIASTITFPYLWLGLFALLWWLYKIGFFGQQLGSLIVPGLLCLVLLSPAIPAALTRFLVRPLFSNLLGRDIVSAPGCITALVGVVVAGFTAVYFLSRGLFQKAGLLLLVAPAIAAVLAGVVSLMTRSGRGVGLLRRRRSQVPSTADSPVRMLGKPRPPEMTGPSKPPALPTNDRPALPGSSPRAGRRPVSRRPDRRNSQRSSSRRPSPPRRKS